MDPQVMELFKDPKKCYSTFSKAVVQDAEANNLNAVSAKLLCFNEVLNGHTINKETLPQVIDEIVCLGIVEMMWQVFVKIISQPVSASLTKALMVLLEALCNVIEISNTAKSKSRIFLPYLVRNIVGKAENECRLRIEATKLINTLLEEKDRNNDDQINDIKKQKTIRDNIGTLLNSADDFELQALILEMVFRLIAPSERTSYISTWFDCEQLQQLFVSIDDTSFEPGCRKFLNKLNSSKPDTQKRVYTIPCQRILFGNEKISLAKDTDSNNYWIDFNLGSKTLKFFVEEKDDKDDESWWHTVVIGSDNVSSCLFMEPYRNGLTIKIILKDDSAKLIPSLPERGDHNVFIRLSLESNCDQQTLSDILHKMTWMTADYLSPIKTSVAINVVHVGSRYRGAMEVIPSVTPKPPEALMEADSTGDREDPIDHNDTDYPASLTTESQPISISSQKQDSQEIDQGQQNHDEKRTEEDKDKEEPPKEDNSQSQRVLRPRKRTATSEKPSSIENINQNGPTVPEDDDKTYTKLANRTKEKTRGLSSDEKSGTEKRAVSNKKNTNNKKSQDKSVELDNGADSSSSSSRQGSRIARSTPKRTKSPLPIEIKKGKQPRNSSSSSLTSSTDDEAASINKTHGGMKTTLKSPFDIAKETPKDTKTYPKAFNVAKRMGAKKNNAKTALSHSQELTKKVFGQTGRSINQKTSHITKPKPSQSNSPSSKEPLSKDKDIGKDVSTNSEPESSDHEEEQIEVIQDSFPLEDSPEKIPRRRSDIPKTPDRIVLDKRLVKSAQPTKRTKKRATPLERVPARLGTILRKGGTSTRSSFLKKENSGWGSSTSTSTTSTSETDWPGLNADPGPKPRHSLVPHLSIREKRGARNKAVQLARAAKHKRASVSPGLNSILEERSPTAIDEELEPVGDQQIEHEPEKSIDNHPKQAENEEITMEPELLDNDAPNDVPKNHESKGPRKQHSKVPVKGPSQRPKKTPKATHREDNIISIHRDEDIISIHREDDLNIDLPNLVLEGSPEDKNISGTKSDDNEKDDDAVGTVPAQYDRKRKAHEDSDDGYDEVETPSAKDEKNQLHDEKARKRKAQEDVDDDYEEAKKPTSKGRSLFQDDNKSRNKKSKEQHSKRHLSDVESDDDLDGEYTPPKKLKTFNTAHTAKNYDKAKRAKTNTNTRSKETLKTSSKGHSDPVEDMSPGYDAVDDFDALENVSKESKKVNTTKTMLKPARVIGNHTKEKRSAKNTALKQRVKPTKESKKTALPRTVQHDKTPLLSIKEHKQRVKPTTERQQAALPRTVQHDETLSIKEHKKPSLASSGRKKSTQKDLENHECGDSEAAKLRQFCQTITDGYSSTPKPKTPSDEIHGSRKTKNKIKEFNLELDDSDDEELSGYSEVETIPTKRLNDDKQDESLPGKKRTTKATTKATAKVTTSHETPRLHPSITQVTTNERFGRLQSSNPSKWKTPSNKHSRLDDSGIGETPSSTGLQQSRSISSASTKTNKDHSYKGRKKGELVVTKTISKTPITPRTSAIIRRINEEQSHEHHVEKPRRTFKKTVDWTSSGPSKEPHYEFDEDDNDDYVDDDNDEDNNEQYINRVPERPKAKGKVEHNPHIKPRQLFKDHRQNEEFEDDDSAINDITTIITDLEGTLTERLRGKRNHLHRFCKKTFDVTLETVNKHIEESLSSRNKIIDSFNDQFSNEMNTLKDEMDMSQKKEEEIMSRIQEDIRVLKAQRVIQENKMRCLKTMCVGFQSEMMEDNSFHPDHQSTLQDNIREELVNIQRNFMREAQAQDRENLRRSLRSVLDVTMM